MFSNKIVQRATVGLGAVIAGLAVSVSAFAGTASTEPIGPDGPTPKAGHCAIVHHDGNGNEWVEYVPTGSGRTNRPVVASRSLPSPAADPSS